MLKKLSMLLVAFAVGAMVSLSIQACADDYKESPNPNKTESSSDTRDFLAWKNNGIESNISYDEDGQISSPINYTYNNKGWLTKMTAIGYARVSGVRYKSTESTYTYTYSSSGDVQYCNMVTTIYNENGQKIGSSRSSTEVKLCK